MDERNLINIRFLYVKNLSIKCIVYINDIIVYFYLSFVNKSKKNVNNVTIYFCVVFKLGIVMKLCVFF